MKRFFALALARYTQPIVGKAHQRVLTTNHTRMT